VRGAVLASMCQRRFAGTGRQPPKSHREVIGYVD
jgi:hypothetical protein